MYRKQADISFLRITAMLMVFLAHTQNLLPQSTLVRFLVWCAPNGVAIFFVISGYCAFLGEYKNNLLYYKKRCLRILPIYWSTYHVNVILRCFVCGILSFDIGRYLIGVLGLQMAIPTDEYGWNGIGATGSISTFILFYMLVPLFRKKIVDKKTAWQALGVGTLVCAVNRVLLVVLLPRGGGTTRKVLNGFLIFHHRLIYGIL